MMKFWEKIKSVFKRKKVKTLAFNWNLIPPTAEEAEEAKQREVRKKERGRARSFSSKATEIAVLSATMLTCDMVFMGLDQELKRSFGESLHNSLVALSVAMGLSLCIFVGFMTAQKLSVTMARVSSFVGAWLCIFAFCLWAVGTSSWFAFMSMTGAPALEQHLNAATDKLEKAVAAATLQIKNARGVPAAMEAKAAGFGARGASEASGGGATGAKGAGPLSQSLEGAAAVLTTGAGSIRTAIEKGDSEAALMRSKLREISEAINDRSRPVYEREAAFLKGASELRASIAAMNDAGLGEIVRSTLTAVESAVSVMPTDGSKVGARQSAAIDQTRKDMENIAGSLRKVLGELEIANGEAGSLVETVSLSEVVWTYKHKFKPALFLAIGIDLFAVWALIFLGLHGIEEVRRREKKEGYVSLIDLNKIVLPALAKPELVNSVGVGASEPVKAEVSKPVMKNPVVRKRRSKKLERA